MASKSDPRGLATSPAPMPRHQSVTMMEKIPESSNLAENGVNIDKAVGKATVSSGEQNAKVQLNGNGTNVMKPWVNLFRSNRAPENCIKLEKKVEIGERLILHESEIDTIENAWGHSLVGFFVGQHVSGEVMQKEQDKWGVYSQRIWHPSGWMIFRFKSEEDKLNVLEKSPYTILGRPFILKEVPRLFEMDDAQFNQFPIWVQLPGLPLDCWNGQVLSRIGSRIGSPIISDVRTKDKSVVQFARILVEVDVSKPITRNVEIEMPGGKVRVQPVHYEINPVLCIKCRKVGHLETSCNNPEFRGGINMRGRNQAKNGRSRTRNERYRSASRNAPRIVINAKTTGPQPLKKGAATVLVGKGKAIADDAIGSVAGSSIDIVPETQLGNMRDIDGCNVISQALPGPSLVGNGGLCPDQDIERHADSMEPSAQNIPNDLVGIVKFHAAEGYKVVNVGYCEKVPEGSKIIRKEESDTISSDGDVHSHDGGQSEIGSLEDRFQSPRGKKNRRKKNKSLRHFSPSYAKSTQSYDAKKGSQAPRLAI